MNTDDPQPPPQRQQDAPDLVRVAHHEAGHAVFMHMFSVAIIEVTIAPAGAVLGRVRTDSGVWTGNLRRLSRSVRGDVLGDIESWLAGPMAEAAWMCPGGTVADVMGAFDITAEGQSDLTKSSALARRVSFTSDEARYLVKQLARRVAGRIIHHQPIRNALCLLVEALLEHRTLDGGQVHWLVMKGLRGRQYGEVRNQLTRRLLRGDLPAWLGIPERLEYLIS